MVPSLVVRDLNGATADEFANNGVAGNEPSVGHLRGGETFDGFEQRLDAFVANARVNKPGVVRKCFGRREQALLSAEEWLERGQIKRKSAVDDVVGQPHEGDDAEEFAGADVVPVQNGAERAVVAMMRVAEHPPDEPDVGEMREFLRAAVALDRKSTRLNSSHR